MQEWNEIQFNSVYYNPSKKGKLAHHELECINMIMINTVIMQGWNEIQSNGVYHNPSKKSNLAHS